MKTFSKLLVTTLLLSFQTFAQLAITNGGFEMKFPTADWVKREPPSALREMITKNAGSQLLIYAESPRGKFFVSRFDYPRMGDKSGFVAGFIGGVRNSSAKGGTTNLQEQFGTFPGTQIPTYTFDRPMQGSFLHTTAIFCADRLYNVQIVAPESARVQVLKCLEGVAVHDAPLPAAVFDKGTKPGAAIRSVAYEMGKVFGMVAAIGTIIAIGFGIAYLVNRSSRKRPPPLPQ